MDIVKKNIASTLLLLTGCTETSSYGVLENGTVEHVENDKTQFINHAEDESVIPRAEAIRRAEKLFIEAYGERILSQKPWRLKEIKDIYWISGTFREEGVGGTAELQMDKFTGETIKLFHGK